MREELARRSLSERAVRAMLVVVADVSGENSFEVPAVHDQDPVGALAACSADPSFDEGVRARRSYRCTDRSDAFGTEHLIERGRELAVAVVDQKPDRLRPLDERREIGRAHVLTPVT